MTDYSQAWDRYRSRRNRFIIVACSIVPGLVLLRVMDWLVPNVAVSSVASAVLVLGWFFGTIITSYQAQYCPCPRCGKQFSSTGWYHKGMVFARRCAHCGLPKYANSELAES